MFGPLNIWQRTIAKSNKTFCNDAFLFVMLICVHMSYTYAHAFVANYSQGLSGATAHPTFVLFVVCLFACLFFCLFACLFVCLLVCFCFLFGPVFLSSVSVLFVFVLCFVSERWRGSPFFQLASALRGSRQSYPFVRRLVSARLFYLHAEAHAQSPVLCWRLTS